MPVVDTDTALSSVLTIDPRGGFGSQAGEQPR